MNYRSAFEEAIVNMTSNSKYIHEYLFYHRILINCQVLFKEDLKAPAGVSINYKRFTLYINPIMFNPLTLEQRLAILKHEALHIIHNHAFRAKAEHKINHKIWNIATDCAINQQCNKAHLSGLDCVDYETLAENLKLNIEIPADLDSESYFELIKQELKNQGRDSDSISLNIDTHETWNESQGDPEVLKDLIKDIIEKAVDSTLKGKGNVPLYINELLKIYSSKSEISWNTVLRNIVGDKKANTRTTIQKRDRRFPNRLDLRGTVKDRSFSVLEVLDISGSVRDRELQHVLSETVNICSLTGTDLDLIQIDTEARNPEKINKSTKVFNRTGSGGTILKSAIDKAREFKLDYDCVVVCTDGYIDESDVEAYKKLNKRIIWLITSDGKIKDSMNSGLMKAFKLNPKNI